MRSARITVTGVALSLVVGLQGHAQDRSASASNDPRVGLKPGSRDAGEAIRNLERVASLPKPAGFFNPEAPAGNPTPPESSEPNPEQPPAFDPVASNRLAFTNSDLAFSGHNVFVGNYHGFN